MVSDYQALQALCREDFGSFAAKAFSIVEPNGKYERNWHIDCVVAHLEAVARGDIKRLIINIPPRTLKPVAENSLVYTGRGLIPLREVNAGDSILTHSGSYRRVNKVSKQGALPTLRLTTDKGRILDLEGSHPVLTSEGWVQAKNLTIGTILAAVYPQEHWDGDMSPEEARLLGYLVGDGCCKGTPHIMVDDELEEQDIIRCAEAMGFYPRHHKKRVSKQGRSYGRIALCSGPRRNSRISVTKPWMESHGLMGKTSYTKRVPQAVLRGGRSAAVNFLAAYWACDGTMHTRNAKGTFYIGCDSVNRDLLGDIQLLLQGIGINSRIRRKETKIKTKRQGETYVSYSLSLCTQDDRYLFVKQIKLPHRKQSHAEGAHIRRTDFGRIIVGDELVSIEAGPEQLCRCLEVEQDHSFVAQGIAVHNSYLVARAFPAWMMGKKPQTKFIVASYGHEVAEQNSMACRKIMKDPWYQETFPGTRFGELDRNTHFETTQSGQYYAASALSPVTGLGADIVLLDDPIKPMEASSDTIRNSTNENIRTTFFSRLNDKRTGAIILVMQRVHEEDPTGHLLKDGGWVHLKLPAEAHEDIIIEIGDKRWEMKRGDLLFPARLSREILDRTRLDMSDYHYSGQYLQSPVPSGGGEFKEEWMQVYAQGGVKPKEMNIVILVDPAGGEELNRKKKRTSDWTVMAVIGLAPDNNYYLLDMVRDRLNPTERVDTLFMLHRKWNTLTGKPPKVGYEKYGMMTDTFYIREKQKQDAYNFGLIEVGGGTMKEERIRTLIPDMQNSRWYFPGSLPYLDTEGRKFDLIAEIKNEMTSFPKARWDDILDTLSRVYSPELNLIFPKPRATMAARAYAPRDEATGDWYRDF